MDWDLKITDMAGATPEHSAVIVNFVAAIRYQLKNSTCYVYSDNVQYRFAFSGNGVLQSGQGERLDCYGRLCSHGCAAFIDSKFPESFEPGHGKNLVQGQFAIFPFPVVCLEAIAQVS